MCRRIIAIAVSMLALAPVVNTFAAEKQAVNRSTKSDLKDSVKDTDKKDLAQLLDVMMKVGREGRMGENLAPVIGLPGPLPMKAANIRNIYQGKDRDALNCLLIYEEVADSSASAGKRPMCIYLMKITESPQFQDAQYFRISLDGKLEKVVTNRGKKDDNGQLIRGSGTPSDDDIDSAVVRKTYAAEMRELKAWLKTQQKLLAKAGTAHEEKGKNETVRAAASAESKALDHEAAAAASPQAAQ